MCCSSDRRSARSAAVRDRASRAARAFPARFCYARPAAPSLAARSSELPGMLLGLTIRDVVLIDRLALAFRPGLCVLTGETGAGKSILLDALGLTLGRRAEAGLVRAGAKEAAVSAEFAVGRNHPAHAILREAGLDSDGETIVLRRLLDPANHRVILDAFAEYSVGPAALAQAWHDWRAAREREAETARLHAASR